MKSLGTMYIYTGKDILIPFIVGPKVFKSVAELKLKYHFATEKDISQVELLDNFMGQQNVIKITPIFKQIGKWTPSDFIIENNDDPEGYVYFEQDISKYPDKAPFWKVGKGILDIGKYYDAFYGLNAECKESLKDTAYFREKAELLKKFREKNLASKNSQKV